MAVSQWEFFRVPRSRSTIGVNLMPHAENGSVAANTITDSTINITNVNGTVLSAEDVLQREQHYLKRVMKDCAGLEWLSLMDLRDENSQRLELDAVYTALLTTTAEVQRMTVHEDERLAKTAICLGGAEPRTAFGADGRPRQWQKCLRQLPDLVSCRGKFG